MSTSRDRRIAGEIKQLFNTRDVNILSIQGVNLNIARELATSFFANEKNFVEDMKKIMEPKVTGDNNYVLTVVCRQFDRSHIKKNVTYIFIIPEKYPFNAPIIKTDRLSETYNGYGLPQVNISSENDIDTLDIGTLTNNTVLNVAGIVKWDTDNTLLDIIKGSQTRELDPSIHLDSQSKSNEELSQQMLKNNTKTIKELHDHLGGRQQTKKNRKNKRKINKRNKYNKRSKKNKNLKFIK